MPQKKDNHPGKNAEHNEVLVVATSTSGWAGCRLTINTGVTQQMKTRRVAVEK